MKRLPVIVHISLCVLLFSCGNEPAKEEPKAADTTAAVAETKPEKPVFKPFKVVVIQQKVKNFAKAQAGYYNSDSIRNAYGINHFVMGRDVKDSNNVFVMDKIEDVERAKSFFTQPKVAEAMTKAGVSKAPAYTYAEMVRASDAPAESPDRVAVTHHVKDYAVWLKAFDAEGPASRAANGLADLGIARNLNDSNTVSILFVVTDMQKAKARMSSPELKKIMTDAGVDGTPTIRWFRIVK